ncbi:hypothetical protein DFH05DRAFT_1530753 [Lentinula detonsa]|uniref:Uncharacterized protein n=1 Tax=Lentinula detonsa TaxID=2804962 RepID=A0A9W8NQU4_9AGAR|nr:hypothetical protein DFH05DRAFT_1530753 [Lentinula detonsa]KAJ3983465.1 hypothetical protein F5890DRAFT_193478 [Lentinula detonsa]
MVFRLPSQLESFVPAPASQAPNTADAVYTPWRGQFLVSGTRASDIGSNVNIRVTGVETDGDTSHRQSHLWPSRFVFSVTSPHALPILPQLQTYMRHRSPPIPLTTFVPDRIRDPDQNAVNQSQFRSLSRLLWDGQLVAIVVIALTRSSTTPGGPGRHGILLFPSPNSSAVLYGAVFLTSTDTFPDFVLVQGAIQATPPSFAHTYGGSMPRGRSSVPTFIDVHPRGYEQHHMNPMPYSSGSQIQSQGSQRHSSHSVSPTSAAEHHSSYRYASPIPSQNRAAYGQSVAFDDNSAEYVARYQSESESPTDPNSVYQYPARGHSGYRQ